MNQEFEGREETRANVEGVHIVSESGVTSFIPCNPGKVSDGYHTFEELYEHRCLLFVALMKAHPDLSWRSTKHDDGTTIDGWFIAGMNLDGQPITYHLPNRLWGLLEGSVPYLDKAPGWDGHTSQDVLVRLRQWVEPEQERGATA